MTSRYVSTELREIIYIFFESMQVNSKYFIKYRFFTGLHKKFVPFDPKTLYFLVELYLLMIVIFDIFSKKEIQ